MIRYLGMCIIGIMAVYTVSAQHDTAVKEKLVVGMKETPPFIIKRSDGSYGGVSIALWEELAAQMNVEYNYQTYSLSELMDAVKRGDVDISINPLTVTSSRIRDMEFTQPFFITNLAIATTKQRKSQILLFIQNLFSWEFFQAVILLFIVILAFGFVAWLFERRKNPEQFKEGPWGIWDGIWWSAVTMTTVGYGDKAPVSLGGKLIALVWMFTAIIIISGFTGSIASSLTLDQLSTDIKGPEDLKRVGVGAVSGTTGEIYLMEKGISHETYDSALEGLRAVENGNLDAFVYDEPIMKYLVPEHGLDKVIIILPHKFKTQYYSYSLPKNSDLVDKLNPVLLKEIEDVKWQTILEEYNLISR